MRLLTAPDVLARVSAAEIEAARGSWSPGVSPCTAGCGLSLGDVVVLVVLDDGQQTMCVLTHPRCLASGVYAIDVPLPAQEEGDVRVVALLLDRREGQLPVFVVELVDQAWTIGPNAGGGSVDLVTEYLLSQGWEGPGHRPAPGPCDRPLKRWWVRAEDVDGTVRITIPHPPMAGHLVEKAPVSLPEGLVARSNGEVLVLAASGLGVDRRWQQLPDVLAEAVADGRLCHTTLVLHRLVTLRRDAAHR